MTRLSVNINKVALIRNSRGEDLPNLIKVARDSEEYGGQGITVHPRPDERHITYEDVRNLKPQIKTEFNVEGYPSRAFLDLVLEVKPHQVTLVPDPPDALTSSTQWHTLEGQTLLKSVIEALHEKGIRTSIFLNPDPKMAEEAEKTGTDRVELYTAPYARDFKKDSEKAIEPYLKPAQIIVESGLGLNAGHDLNLDNLSHLHKNLPELKEVSIGHALICDALYYGLENTIKMYQNRLK